MVKLRSAETFIKDPVDVWGKEQTIGLAELAVRTHAPAMAYDRQGSIIRWVDFESATPNYSEYTHSAAAFSRTTDVANSGDFGGKISVTNATDYCTITQFMNDFHLGKLGAECKFASASTNYLLQVAIVNFDGVNRNYARAQYDPAAKSISILTTSGEVTIAAAGTVSNYASEYNFSTCKVVADLSTMKYIRLLMFGKEYDISEYSIPEYVDATGKHLACLVKVYGSSVGAGNVYIDDMLTTENES